MLLYNVTIGIDQDAEAEWLTYIRQTHIPEIMGTKMFKEFRVFKVLQDNPDETVSYSLQFFAEDISQVSTYLETFAPVIVERHRSRFMNKHVTFMTLLEEI